MANLRVSLDLEGLGLAERAVDGMRLRADNLRPPLQRIGSELLRARRRQFASGKGWRRLAASTRARKARQGLDPRRMVATGALERSLTRTGAVKVTRSELRHGTSVWYARFHVRGGGTLPRRKPVMVRAAERRAWRERIGEYIVGDAGP